MKTVVDWDGQSQFFKLLVSKRWLTQLSPFTSTEDLTEREVPTQQAVLFKTESASPCFLLYSSCPELPAGSDQSVGMTQLCPTLSPSSCGLTAWSPEWRGYGRGWIGWLCPCTASDVSWFPPAASGHPLTAETCQTLHFSSSVMFTHIYASQKKKRKRKGSNYLFCCY